MTNTTKWFIALPFAFFVAFVIPVSITQNWLWFTNDWASTIYVMLTAGLWLIATGFVDLEKPRKAPDLANLLIPIGLLLSNFVAIADKVWGFAMSLPDGLVILAILMSFSAIVLGMSARINLGHAYSPRGTAHLGTSLIRQRPYKYIRHPLYLSALIWSVGWHLFLKSFLGCLTALVFIIPAIFIRIKNEELDLIRIFGDDYRKYQEETWRILPFIY